MPTVSQDDTVRRLLAACPDKFEGRRNRALVALLPGDLLCLIPNLVDVVAVEEAHGSPGLVVEGEGARPRIGEGFRTFPKTVNGAARIKEQRGIGEQDYQNGWL